MYALAGALLAVMGLTLAPIVTPSTPAGAISSGTVLILSTSVTGGSSSPEATAAINDGYSVSVVSPTTWDSLTEANFASYSAIILGDPTCGTSASDAIGAAVSDASTWSAAISGNEVIEGTDPVGAASGPNPSGANAVTDDAVDYALGAGPGTTGLYVSLSCYYATAAAGTSIPVLADLPGAPFTVGGGSSCSDSGTLDVPVQETDQAFTGMTNSALYGWSCSVEETFGEWPSNDDALGLDPSASPTPSELSEPDGATGQPYILLYDAPYHEEGGHGVGGGGGGTSSWTDPPTSETYGASDPAAPGITKGIVTAGSGVNPATGDFTNTATDASASTYGPNLEIDRTYDAKLAQAEAASGAASGIFGYGWSSNVGASLGFETAPNNIYTEENGFTAPTAEKVDSSGNIYIADPGTDTIKEIAATTHYQWGWSTPMTAGQMYTIAGSGHLGDAGNGAIATSANLGDPSGVAVDASGNLYFTDPVNYRVEEEAATSGTQWGISMSPGRVYTIAGVNDSSGCTSDASNTGYSPLLNKMSSPSNLAVDSSGDLYISDMGDNRVLELARTGHSQWGFMLTAGDLYRVVGRDGCTGGDTGDGAAANLAYLDGPAGLSLDSSGDLFVADSYNNRVQEVAAVGGTQWGHVTVVANDVYTIAGNASGTAGYSGDGGLATAALLDLPFGIATDSSGNLYIADWLNSRIQEVSRTSHSQWGRSFTQGDMNTIDGSASGTPGYRGDGGPGTSALLSNPFDVALDSSGDLLILDWGNDALREEVATIPASDWALSPTPITVNQASGAQITYEPPIGGACPSGYQGSGTPGSYCAPPDVNASLTYQPSSNNFSFVTHPYESYTFNASGQLTADTEPGGASLTVSYGTPSPGTGQCPSIAAKCDTVTSASGRSLVLALTVNNRVYEVTDPLGNSWGYTYSSGDLVDVTNALGKQTSYTYDTSNSNPNLVRDLLSVTQPNGQSGGADAGDSLVNTYNSAGEVTSQTDPGGRTTSFNYSSMSFSSGTGDALVTDPDANKTQYSFTSGILTGKIVGYGSAVPSNTTYYPSSSDLLLNSSVVDPDDGVTSYEYDADGNVLSTTNAMGQEETSSYNSFDEPTCTTIPFPTTVTPCSSDSPPGAAAPGGTISPPSAAPPEYTTYYLYDTNGNQLWKTTGVYEPGATSAAYSQTTYNLYGGNSVVLGGVTDSCGSTPPSSSLPCATIDADGNVTQLAYDSAGDVTASSTPDGNGTELASTTTGYDADGNQTSTTSPDGNLAGANAANYTTTTTYDADHEPLIVTLAGGSGATVPARVTATYYDPDGNEVATTDASGNPYSASNPTGCNPLTTSSCAGTTYDKFDADDEKTLVTDPAGNQTLTCYDGDGNVAETVPPWGVANNALTPASCPSSYPSGYSSTPLASDATMTAYDALGNATAVIAPGSTGGSDATTSTTYDPSGQAIATVAPSATSGGSTQTTLENYNLAGKLTLKTLALGGAAESTTTNCYDPEGDQTSVVPGDGNATTLQNCNTASPWTTGSPDETTSSYDSVGELVSTTSPPTAGSTSPSTTTYTYDPAGNKLTMTDPDANVTTYSYNPQNKLASTVTSGQNSTSYYDASGNVVATTAPGGNPYSSSNPTGCDPVTTSGCSYTTYNTYNSSNQLLTSTNPDGGVTTNYYDTRGNKIATTGPSGNPSTCNPTTSSTPCADTTTYTYNNLSQVTCEGEPNSANNTCASPGDGTGIITYTYTSDGKRASMTDSTGTTSYQYDALDRLISTTNGAGATVTYGYGQNSELNCISYPNSAGNTCNPSSPCPTTSTNGIVCYSYNQANQMTEMTDWAGNSFDYGYDANDSVTSLSINEGAVDVATAYDDAGNVSSIDATVPSSSTNLLSLSYTRDADGNVLTSIPEVGSTMMPTDTYGYNALSQVNSGPITGTMGSSNYAYTSAGGITQDTTSFASAGYDQAGVLCWTSATTSTNTCGSPPSGATTYATNADGERTSTQPATGNPQSYSWDSALGTMSCANTDGTTCSTSSPTSSTAVYGYNGDGLRTSSTIDSTTTNYTWDSSSAIPQLMSDGNWDYLYVPGDCVPVEQISASGPTPTSDLLLTDTDNSVRGLVQLSSGADQYQLVNYTDYDAYGDPITSSAGSAETGGLTVPQTSINSNYVGVTPFGFGGGYTDLTDLVYLVHRYYDPTTGQFITVDPMLAQTKQPYEYAANDPVNEVDPTGEDALGCNQLVCIHVYGTGLHVPKIDVWDRPVEPTGLFAVFYIYVNGHLTFPGAFDVSPVSDAWVWTAHYPKWYNFPQKAKVCGGISDFPGLPCETVHR